MDPLVFIAERRIEEAMKAGLFDGLPGEGRPLLLDSNAFEDPARRITNIVLRNAKVLPPEVELRREISTLKEKLAATADSTARDEVAREINKKILTLNTIRKDYIPTAEPELPLSSERTGGQGEREKEQHSRGA